MDGSLRKNRFALNCLCTDGQTCGSALIVFPLILCYRLNGVNCVIALLSFLISFFAISDLLFFAISDLLSIYIQIQRDGVFVHSCVRARMCVCECLDGVCAFAFACMHFIDR